MKVVVNDIQRELADPVAMMILSGTIGDGDTLRVDVDGVGADGRLTLTRS